MTRTLDGKTRTIRRNRFTSLRSGLTSWLNLPNCPWKPELPNLNPPGYFFFSFFLSLPIQNLIFHRIISTTMSISLWQREGAKGREQALKSAHVCMKADSAALTGFKEGSGGKLSTTCTNSRTARTSSGCRVGLGEKEGGEGRGGWCYEKALIDMHACKCDLDTRCLTACCSQRENQSLPHPHRLPPPPLSCQCACARARVWKTSV